MQQPAIARTIGNTWPKYFIKNVFTLLVITIDFRVNLHTIESNFSQQLCVWEKTILGNSLDNVYAKGMWFYRTLN